MSKDLPEWVASKNNLDMEWPSNSSSDQEEQKPEIPAEKPQQHSVLQKEDQVGIKHKELHQNQQINEYEMQEDETKSQKVNPLNSIFKLITGSQSLINLQKLEELRDQSKSPMVIFTCSDQKTILVMDHFVKRCNDRDRGVRLSHIIRDIQDNKLTIRQGIIKLNPKDLEIMTEHKLLLTCLEKITSFILAKMPAFASFKHCNFFQIIDNTYHCISQKIEFETLKEGLIQVINRLYPNIFPNKLLEDFSKKVMLHSEGMFERKKAEKRRLRNKRLREKQISANQTKDKSCHRIQGIDEEDEVEPNFDGQSFYGFFSNQKQEFQRNNEGIYNYRMHRTFNYLAKLTTLDPFKNIQKAKDYTLFLIKLSDLHIRSIMKQTLINSKLDLKNKVTPKYPGISDEFSYFQPQHFKSANSEPSGGKMVMRCVYPSLLTRYNDLRYKQIAAEAKLHMEMYPQIFLFMSKNQKQNSKLQKKINDYYEYAETSKQVSHEFTTYREPSRPHLNRIKIQIEHLTAVLENYHLYWNSVLLFRLRNVYF